MPEERGIERGSGGREQTFFIPICQVVCDVFQVVCDVFQVWLFTANANIKHHATLLVFQNGGSSGILKVSPQF